MKQLFILIWVASLLVPVSCKKENKNVGGGSSAENSFTINGKTYKATKVFYIESSNMIKAQVIIPGTGLNEVNAVSITFSDADLPTVGGIFDIVDDPYSPGDTTNNNQVSVLATTFPYDNGSFVDDNPYHPVLSPVQHVTVSITSSNKVKVKFSNIAVTDINGAASTISGSITEP